MRVIGAKDKGRLSEVFKAAGALLGAETPDGALDGVFGFKTSDGHAIEVVVTYDAKNTCFNLCATVDVVTGADVNMCHALLERNYLFAQTEGAAFAVDPDGTVVLQRDVAATDLEPAALAAAVRSVAGQVAGVNQVNGEMKDKR